MPYGRRHYRGRRRVTRRRYSRRFRPRMNYGRGFARPRRTISAIQRAMMPEIKFDAFGDAQRIIPSGMNSTVPVSPAGQDVWGSQWNITQGDGQGQRIGRSYITKSIGWFLSFKRVTDAISAPTPGIIPVTFRVILLVDTMPNQTAEPTLKDVLSDWYTSGNKELQLMAPYKYQNRSRFKILHDKLYHRPAPVLLIEPMASQLVSRGDTFNVRIHKKVAMRVDMLDSNGYVDVRSNAVMGFVCSDYNESSAGETNRWTVSTQHMVTFTDA